MSGELLDNALILWLPGPASATGEDVAELHLHGGRAVVEGVLETLRTLPGLRHAEPGEFTRRALENGRIDLNEAEGLADLLAAETQSQKRAALLMVGGVLTRRMEEWRSRLIDIAATVEAAIDYPEEEDVLAQDLAAGARAQATRLALEMSKLLAQAPLERLRDGVRVVVAGSPNSGKSSLVNAFCGRDVAITSAAAGTTRDFIEVPAAWNGVPMLLVDTAGLRETDDEIEALGVSRANTQISAADIVIWLDDLSFEFDTPYIHIYPRCDIRPVQHRALPVSALTGHNLDSLKDAVADLARNLLPVEGEVALGMRHRDAVRTMAELLTTNERSSDIIIFADDVRLAIATCDRLTGRSGTEEMLDALFARFCIGK